MVEYGGALVDYGRVWYRFGSKLHDHGVLLLFRFRVVISARRGLTFCLTAWRKMVCNRTVKPTQPCSALMPGTLSSVLTANRLPLRLETKEKKAWMKTNYPCS